ncbi:MAG: hypothetical protein C0592_06800 [Marinilabiliales bacterium]|nr:MAG: hypothetical protein C0592_06800 [Marinilabiliales bacterium]
MMKKIVLLTVAVFFFVSGQMLQAQTADAKEYKVYTLKVNFHCPGGKAKIESQMPEKRGVIKAIADLETKMVEVTYDPSLTDEEHIVEYFHQLGYLTEASPEGTEIKSGCSGNHGEGEGHNHDH